MKLPRRQFLHLVAGAALPAVSRVAGAQAYPTRPVRVMVGFAPGQAIDIVTRIIGQRLSERLGQQFIIENRPGAGGNIATEVVARAPADGYTLLAIGSNNMINPTLYQNLNYDFIRDIAPVASVYRVPQVMEVHPYISGQNGSRVHRLRQGSSGRDQLCVGGQWLRRACDWRAVQNDDRRQHAACAYRGAPPALTDLIAGQVHIMFDNMPSSIEHIRAGRLRPLAVTATTRLEALPDVPPLGDFVPGFETSAWAGIGAPKNTPAEIIDTLNREINAVLADPTIKTRIAELGGEMLALSPSEYTRRIAEETGKWAKVIKFSGAKAE
jgi:tripartite-type tricarboxylate transporter receptor subunit TctC